MQFLPMFYWETASNGFRQSIAHSSAFTTVILAFTLLSGAPTIESVMWDPCIPACVRNIDIITAHTERQEPMTEHQTFRFVIVVPTPLMSVWYSWCVGPVAFTVLAGEQLVVSCVGAHSGSWITSHAKTCWSCFPGWSFSARLRQLGPVWRTSNDHLPVGKHHRHRVTISEFLVPSL